VISIHTARVAPEKLLHHQPAAVFFRGGQGDDMTSKYAEQYRHPEWQKRRLNRLQSADWACERCADRQTTLHVHHKRYVKGRMVWEYEDFELEVLCEPCHLECHTQPDPPSEVVLRIERDFREEAAGVLAAWYPGGWSDSDESVLRDMANTPLGNYGLSQGALLSLLWFRKGFGAAQMDCLLADLKGAPTRLTAADGRVCFGYVLPIEESAMQATNEVGNGNA